MAVSDITPAHKAMLTLAQEWQKAPPSPADQALWDLLASLKEQTKHPQDPAWEQGLKNIKWADLPSTGLKTLLVANNPIVLQHAVSAPWWDHVWQRPVSHQENRRYRLMPNSPWTGNLVVDHLLISDNAKWWFESRDDSDYKKALKSWWSVMRHHLDGNQIVRTINCQNNITPQTMRLCDALWQVWLKVPAVSSSIGKKAFAQAMATATWSSPDQADTSIVAMCQAQDLAHPSTNMFAAPAVPSIIQKILTAQPTWTKNIQVCHPKTNHPTTLSLANVVRAAAFASADPSTFPKDLLQAAQQALSQLPSDQASQEAALLTWHILSKTTAQRPRPMWIENIKRMADNDPPAVKSAIMAAIIDHHDLHQSIEVFDSLAVFWKDASWMSAWNDSLNTSLINRLQAKLGLSAGLPLQNVHVWEEQAKTMVNAATPSLWKERWQGYLDTVQELLDTALIGSIPERNQKWDMTLSLAKDRVIHGHAHAPAPPRRM